MKGTTMSNEVPHVWHTVDSDGEESRHLAMSQEGAEQAHLLHFGLAAYDGSITATDEGPITAETRRNEICFAIDDIIYGLSFP